MSRSTFLTMFAGFAVLAFLPAQVAHAGLFGSKLTIDGDVDTVDDNSRAFYFDNDGNNLFSSGDEYVSIVRMDAFNGTNVNSDELIFGAYAVELTDSPVAGVFNTAAATGTNSLQTLLDDALEPGSFAFDGSEFFAVLSKQSSLTADNPFASDSSPVSNISTLMTAANGWELEMIAGFDGVDDFLQFGFIDSGVDLIDNPINGGNGDGILQVSEAIASNDGVAFFDQTSAFSIEYNTFAPGFLPVSALKLSGGSGVGDMVIKPFGSIQSTATSATNYNLEDDANFQLNPVPEPGSLAIFGLIGVSGALARRRRRNKQA